MDHPLKEVDLTMAFISPSFRMSDESPRGDRFERISNEPHEITTLVRIDVLGVTALNFRLLSPRV
ncbi:hypothetical protein ACTXT7_014573 [Hymenolepis weldensis]